MLLILVLLLNLNGQTVLTETKELLFPVEYYREPVSLKKQGDFWVMKWEVYQGEDHGK